MAFMNAAFGERFVPAFFAVFFVAPDFRAVTFFAVAFFAAFVPVFRAGPFFAAALRAGGLPAFFAAFFGAALLADGLRAAAFLLPGFFVRAIERLRQRVVFQRASSRSGAHHYETVSRAAQQYYLRMAGGARTVMRESCTWKR
jgi:hypothetical protein